MEDPPMGSADRGETAEGLAIETMPAPENRTDADIIADMKVRLAREAWVSNRGIWVDARDGTIALVGVVNSETEKAALGAMAREIDGCRGVENHLLVKSKWRDYGVA
jgi:osmotically-inducible protein OsmY